MLSDSEIDVFAINESKIDNSVKDSEISIPGYNMIRRDRNRFGGGVVVYIREIHSFYERKDLNSDDLEMICIEICKPRSKPFLISAWHRPPNSEIKLFDFFEIFLSKCDAESKELLVIGDINCNMIKSPKDSSTNKLIFLSTLYNLETTLSLIENIPGIPMYVWKQNIVWFLVNTEPEASSDEVFRLFERQKPLPFD